MCGTTSSRRTHVERYVIVNLRQGCGRDLLPGASSRVSRVFQRSDGRDLTNRAGHPSRCYHLPSTVRATVHFDPFFDFISSRASLAVSGKPTFKFQEIAEIVIEREKEGEKRII